MQNLVPPSHFDKDSLDGSPQISGGKIFPTVSSQKSSPASGKLLLKTPGDFCTPPSVDQPVQRRVFPIANLQSQHVSSYPATSQDSIYNWEHSKGDFGTNNNLQSVLNELKKENDHLHKLISQSSSEKDAKCNYNVITHQVQYIERLQQDISAATSKLNDRESNIAKLETDLLEKEAQIQQQNHKLIQISEELQQEREKTLLIEETITNLKSNLISSEKEQKELSLKHESALQLLKQNHQVELEKLEENFRSDQTKLELRIEAEKQILSEEVNNTKKRLDIEHQSSIFENERKFEEKLKCAEARQLKSEERNETLQKEFAELQQANNSLKENLQSVNEELNGYKSAMEKCEDEASRLTSQLKDFKESNSKLRTYIAQVQESEHAREQWKVEKMEMIAAISDLNDNKEELQKTLEMLNVRFHSVSKILEMQEQAVTAHTNAITDPQLQNKAAVVTSQWRAKVFELMVQCKSQEIITKQEESKHKLIVKDLSTKLEDEMRNSEILANRLRDVRAQLELKDHLNIAMESSNAKLEQELRDCQIKCDQQHSSIEKLRDVVEDVGGTCAKSYEEGLAACLEKCLRMEQRLAFATNRVRTIQDLMKRKDSIWRVRLQQAMQNQNEETVSAEKQLNENPDLRMELLQLTEERNSLSHQLAHDAAEFESTIKSMKQTEKNYLETNRSLEKQIHEYEEKIKQLNATLQGVEGKLDDEKYVNDSLSSELNKAKLATKKEVEEALEVSKQHHYEEMREREIALNQTKKELTKAVVTLRQAERNSVREKNQLTEQLHAERELWSKEEEKLRNNIRNLQKDNNLLMTTLRQEGLLSTIKAARGSPILEKFEDETPPKRVHFDRSPPKESKVAESRNSVEVDEMLKDLTNLSEMVLANSDTED